MSPERAPADDDDEPVDLDALTDAERARLAARAWARVVGAPDADADAPPAD